ncbi:MAG: hypothetical protein QNJ78_05585 [Gammaproteobacteria bacterium]|nr:hypothetical protein [Gammaproteobacteria bacterium]
MKPDTATAMRNLIDQVRENVPFDLTNEAICADSCEGCSVKLLNYLESELDAWELRLQAGERPNFGDLDKLAATSRKIHRVLKENNICR